MPEPTPITIPLINPNEPEALLASLHISAGQRVSSGQPLCLLETTKATHELVAVRAGYVAGLVFQAGQSVRAGDILCYLADSPDWSLPEAAPSPAQPGESGVPPGLRITQPALALARERGVDLSALPSGPLVTEQTIRDWLIQAGGSPQPGPPPAAFDASAILVYGGGGHGKSLIDLIRAMGTYRVVAVVDDGLPTGQSVLGVPVVGGSESLPDLQARGVHLAVNAVGGIGDIAIRIQVFQNLVQAGFGCPAVAHPTAFIEPNASLEAGVQVFPHAYVGSDVRVGFGAIINTGAIVSHDCSVEEYANLSPGAILAGGVTVAAGALIGMGATLNLGVSVGARARVGNGATVKSDVPPGGVVRAGSTWPD